MYKGIGPQSAEYKKIVRKWPLLFTLLDKNCGKAGKEKPARNRAGRRKAGYFVRRSMAFRYMFKSS